MALRHVTVNITTDSAGAAEVYTTHSGGGTVNGKIIGIKYTHDSFVNDVVIAVTTEDTGQTIWSETLAAPATKFHRPKVQNQLPAGTNITGEYDYVHAAGERVKFVVSAGGNAKVGRFDLWWYEHDRS